MIKSVFHPLGGENSAHWVVRLFRIMRLTSLFMTLLCVHVSGATLSQTVTLHVKEQPITKVLSDIEAQTGYLIVYNDRYVKQELLVSLQATNQPLETVLKEVLTPRQLTYQIQGKTIAIRGSRNQRASISHVLNTVQQKTVSGKVTDEVGKPLEGVTVRSKGTNAVATTDAVGQYQIVISDSDNDLVYSNMGYVTREVQISGLSVINVVLSVSVSDLDEVVVVGFGQQRKETVTGAISSIGTKDVKQSPAANLAVSLAGRLPGLTSLQRSGEPGNDITNLYIRGRGTVNAQSPIVLVDGIERELTYIDPNEVESVTILKDVSATAVFGVRGANGVILVTTRRGTSEIPEINFSSEFSAQDFPRFFEFTDSYQYAKLRNLALNNDGLGDEFSEEALEKYRTGSDPLRYPNTDWTSIMLKNYAPQQRYNLNVSGAGKMVKYFINAGYLSQGGQFKTEKNLNYDPSFKLDRYNFRSNIDVNLNKNLRTYLNLAGYLERRNFPSHIEGGASSPTGYILGAMATLVPTIPGPLTPDGEVVTHPNDLRPAYGLLNRQGYVQTSSTNIAASYGMEHKLDFITPGLSAKAMLSFDTRAVNSMIAARSFERWVPVIDMEAVDDEILTYERIGGFENTPLSIRGQKSYVSQSNIQAYLEYNRSFDKHDVSAMTLYQQQKNLSNEELPYNLLGVSARFKYGYDHRYFFEFNAGYNGSEQFAPGRRFGFFPALSGGWLVSNESFWPQNSVVNTLKLRGSYGEVGNDRIGNRRFLYLDDIQIVGGAYNADLGRGQLINVRQLSNPQLQWEVARKSNIGVELGVLRSLDLTVDIYREYRDNILRNRGTVPVLNGFPTNVIPPVNMGIIENKGYEVELRYRKVLSNDLSILSSMNVNYAKNKQIFADEPLLPTSFAHRYRETGYPIGQQFGYIIDRYFTDVTDIIESPTQTVVGGSPRPGDFKYKDINGDGVVDERDIAPIGYSSMPEYTFGLAFSVNYKAFDFSFLLQGISNVTNYYSGYGVFPLGSYLERHTNSWTADRHANGEPIGYPRLTTGSSPSQIPNSFFIVDGSYLRLRNMELGYTLPKNLVNRIGIRNLRLYTNGLNLITWDRLPSKDIDAEQTSNYVYPIPRVYNLGVNIIF